MKISEIVKSQVMNKFNQKRQQVIESAVRKSAEQNNINFQEVLNTYIR